MKKYKTTINNFLNRISRFKYSCTPELLKSRDFLMVKLKKELLKNSDFDFVFYSIIKHYIQMSNRELYYKSDILYLNWLDN